MESCASSSVASDRVKPCHQPPRSHLGWKAGPRRPQLCISGTWKAPYTDQIDRKEMKKTRNDRTCETYIVTTPFNMYLSTAIGRFVRSDSNPHARPVVVKTGPRQDAALALEGPAFGDRAGAMSGALGAWCPPIGGRTRRPTGLAEGFWSIRLGSD